MTKNERKPLPTFYCIECEAEKKEECICDDLNHASHGPDDCRCGIHNQI